LEAKEQLQRLVRIQELAQRVRAAQKVVDDAPIRIGEIESRFRERNAEYVAVKDHFDELQNDQTMRSGELSELEQQRDKYMESLMSVKNQREYAAMLKEIDMVKAEISGHEEAILKDMEGVEKLQGELETHEEHIKKEREQVETERKEVEAEAANTSRTIEELMAERAQIEMELPKQVVGTLRRLEASRQGIFLTKAENGTCLSCFVRVRPQVFQEVKLATAVHACGNCRRFLYVASSLDSAKDSNDGTAKASNVEAVNGGAV
jgi:predicted  nucleic acid-binding Zn-ribbon protein